MRLIPSDKIILQDKSYTSLTNAVYMLFTISLQNIAFSHYLHHSLKVEPQIITPLIYIFGINIIPFRTG